MHWKNQEATHFDGATPLVVAACKGHLEMVRFPVEVGAVKDYGTEDGRSNSIVHCSWHSTGYLEIVTFLVEAGAAKIKPQTMEQHHCSLQLKRDS